MTALEHAKRFIRKNAAKTALVIVPLAMASQAQASPIVFDSAGATSNITSTCVSSTSGSGAFTAVPNGADQGVSYGGQFAFGLDVGASGCTGTITLTLSGTGSGELDVEKIPGHFDYTFSGLKGNVQNFSTSIKFYITGTQSGVITAATSGAFVPAFGADQIAVISSPDPELSGWISDEPPDNDFLTDWSVVLTATFDVLTTNTLTLDIPALSSIDILPGAADVPNDPSVPEPATLALVAIGGALVVLQRRSSRR